MDYAEMVSQIMAAEQGAKVLAEESRACSKATTSQPIWLSASEVTAHF